MPLPKQRMADVLPRQDRLLAVDSRIDFEPVANSHPRSLSPDQLNAFNRDGYISSIPVLDTTETQENRSYFDQLLVKLAKFADDRDAYSIMNYHDQCRGIWRLAQHPRILDCVEDLIGPDIVCWTSHYFCKLPRDPKPVHWHQDATYWPIRPTRTVTVWLAVDDVDETNSPMEFISGSHTLGAIPYESAPEDSVLSQEIPDAKKYGKPFANVMPAGSMSIHTSTLIHGSKRNPVKRRCGLTLRYIPPTCGVLEYARKSLYRGIVCRGNGDPWEHIPEPNGDDLSPKPWHRKSSKR